MSTKRQLRDGTAMGGGSVTPPAERASSLPPRRNPWLVVLDVCAILACRLAAIFVRRGALEWPYRTHLHFNAVAKRQGVPHRITRWQHAKMVSEHRMLREHVLHIAGLGIFPWESGR